MLHNKSNLVWKIRLNCTCFLYFLCKHLIQLGTSLLFFNSLVSSHESKKYIFLEFRKYFGIPPVLLRYNWSTSLCNFRAYSIILCYILWNFYCSYFNIHCHWHTKEETQNFCLVFIELEWFKVPLVLVKYLFFYNIPIRVELNRKTMSQRKKR